MRLILASASPRRSLLLRAAGYTFETVVADIDESVIVDEPPAEYVLRLSQEKAAAISAQPHDVVLGADTTVVYEGESIGKPTDAADAMAMLMTLAGRTHSVLTGWTLTSTQMTRFGVEESFVTFNHRSTEELRQYIDRTDPMDKAGAYALQGDDGWLVSRVMGSRSNVMGLPIREIVDGLTDFGISRHEM
ncbi:MAG: septum formation protein Maf [Proteobacteria bacterium]|nr:septum formation protein Maf [Pseudomonadota bacterium]